MKKKIFCVISILLFAVFAAVAYAQENKDVEIYRYDSKALSFSFQHASALTRITPSQKSIKMHLRQPSMGLDLLVRCTDFKEIISSAKDEGLSVSDFIKDNNCIKIFLYGDAIEDYDIISIQRGVTVDGYEACIVKDRIQIVGVAGTKSTLHSTNYVFIGGGYLFILTGESSNAECVRYIPTFTKLMAMTLKLKFH